MNFIIDFQKVVLLIFLAVIYSCSIEPIEREPEISLFNCHDTQEWDRIKIESQILGRWRWVFKVCNSDGQNQNTESYKGQIVEFRDDKSLILTQDGASPIYGTYGITNTNGKYFALVNSPEIEFIKGHLLFCNDELECQNNSSETGCNHFLKKTF